ncbi:MFS transporter [Desulfonatronum thioautotrophicum]|uniref:MFS transporter n=1 Tax=Desulfonatronum thioautotrophicum TaxID=617001 RepID=UPI0005EAED35|nr:MFS transporter [Desulfonatronum thioautotrophicum]
MTSPDHRLPRCTILAYAIPGVMLSMAGVPLFVYLPKFYTDTLGAGAGIVGLFIFGARILDGLADPLIGRLSDRTSTRWGRRRPYLVFASPFLGLCLLALYAPPELTPHQAGIWFGLLLLLLSVTWTLVNVPWEALGPELTGDYHQRNTLFAWRDGLWITGIFGAVTLPLALSLLLDLPETPTGERQKFLGYALVVAPATVLLCWLCATLIRERRPTATSPLEHGTSASPRHVAFRQGLSLLWRNKPFRILTAAFAVAAIGANLPATLILYYVEHVLQDTQAEIYLLLYFLAGIACLPLWVRIAARWGKKPTWMAAMAVNAGAFFGVFFLGPGQSTAFALLAAISGIGFGAGMALPSSMQADVIDYDQLLSGRRREGAFIGLWSIIKKTSSALGLGIALPLLALAGYQPGTEQSESVVVLLRFLYAGLPCICTLAALLIIARYPLDADEHARIREMLAESGARGVGESSPRSA